MRGHVDFRDGKRGRSWFIKYDAPAVNGKRKTVTKRGFKTQKEAEDALSVTLASIVTREYVVTPEKTTLLEYLKNWFKTKNLARTTGPGYRNIIENHIAKDPIGSMLISKLQFSSINSYYARLRETGLKENTLKHHQAILRPALDNAVLDKLLTLNPARFVKLQKIRKYKAAVYDAEQVAKMLECLRGEDIYPPTLLAVFGALRRGEDLGATWQAVDLDHGTLKINKAYYVVDGKAGFDPVKSDSSEDVVYLPDFAVDELRRIKKRQMKQKLQLGTAWQDNDLICCQADGSPWNPSTVSKKFSAALVRHGLPHIRFHDLRHTHATVLHEAGADMKDISDRLRHSTVQITSDIYTDMTVNRKRKVADTFEQAIFGPKKLPRRKRGNHQ